MPLETGYAIRNINAAELANQGLELDAGADLLPQRAFGWKLSANFSTNRNTVKSLAGASVYTLPNAYAGQSLISGAAVRGVLRDGFSPRRSGQL